MPHAPVFDAGNVVVTDVEIVVFISRLSWFFSLSLIMPVAVRHTVLINSKQSPHAKHTQNIRFIRKITEECDVEVPH
jgi:hypothetical protein